MKYSPAGVNDFPIQGDTKWSQKKETFAPVAQANTETVSANYEELYNSTQKQKG